MTAVENLLKKSLELSNTKNIPFEEALQYNTKVSIRECTNVKNVLALESRRDKARLLYSTGKIKVDNYKDAIGVLEKYVEISDLLNPEIGESKDETILNCFLEHAKTFEKLLPSNYEEMSFDDMLSSLKYTAKGIEEITIDKARAFLESQGFCAKILWHIDENMMKEVSKCSWIH